MTRQQRVFDRVVDNLATASDGRVFKRLFWLIVLQFAFLSLTGWSDSWKWWT